MESPEFAAGMRSHSIQSIHSMNGTGPPPPKRKRSTIDSSPASLLDHHDHHDHHDHDHDHDHDLDHGDRDDASPDTKNRRLPGVKRACNECRQQKVRYIQPRPLLTQT
jgi:hypothetical protein